MNFQPGILFVENQRNKVTMMLFYVSCNQVEFSQTSNCTFWKKVWTILVPSISNSGPVGSTLCQPKKVHRNAFSKKGFIQKKHYYILWISNPGSSLWKINETKSPWCCSMLVAPKRNSPEQATARFEKSINRFGSYHSKLRPCGVYPLSAQKSSQKCIFK